MQNKIYHLLMIPLILTIGTLHVWAEEAPIGL